MSLARVPFLRLARSLQTWLSVAGWSALVLGSAWLERRRGAVHGVDHALDLYASIAVPLLVYALVSVAVGAESLAGSGRAILTLGARPLRVALATVLVTAAVSAVLAGGLGALAVAFAHGAGDPPLAQDALHTLGFGALAAIAYAAYFMVGAAVTGRFWGRASLVAVDWILGTDDGLGALLTPRAHLRNLLGGEPPFDALPWQSLAALAVLAIVFAALAIRRAASTRV